MRLRVGSAWNAVKLELAVAGCKNVEVAWWESERMEMRQHCIYSRLMAISQFVILLILRNRVLSLEIFIGCHVSVPFPVIVGFI